MPDYSLYVNITLGCIRAVSFYTPQLREQLSQLSLFALWGVFEMKGFPVNFWRLTSTIIEMLHVHVSHEYFIMAKTVTDESQNLSEQCPHLITDLATICFEAVQKADPNETVTLLVYEARYFDTLQVEASNYASVFPLYDVTQRIRGIIKRIITLHPQRHRLEFTGCHYALVAKYSLDRCRNPNSG